MTTHGQHKAVYKFIPDFLEQMGIDPTKEAVYQTKEMFKRYLKVESTAALSNQRMGKFISALLMLFSREFGKEVPSDLARQSMEQLLKDYNHV